MFDATTELLQVQITPGESVAIPTPAIKVTTHRTVFQPQAWRRLEVMSRLDLLNEFEGQDVTLDRVLAYVQQLYADALAFDARPGRQPRDSSGTCGRHFGDLTIWEGQHLLATFRPLPDGSAEVVRFDR